MEDLIYTLQLGIERDRESILEVSVAAEATPESVAKARNTILELLDRYIPLIDTQTAPALPAPEPYSEPSRPSDNSDGSNGVRGSLLLKCKECGHTFRTFLKNNQRRVSCKCGASIDLTKPLTRFEYFCDNCGRRQWGKTNSEDASIEVRCNCDRRAVLDWSREDKMFCLSKRAADIDDDDYEDEE